LAFDGFAVHPDLVARLSDGDSLVALAARSDNNVLRAMAQADRHLFHRLGAYAP
jgi:hypothetical protein